MFANPALYLTQLRPLLHMDYVGNVRQDFNIVQILRVLNIAEPENCDSDSTRSIMSLIKCIMGDDFWLGRELGGLEATT
jgi:hypothetical protein